MEERRVTLEELDAIEARAKLDMNEAYYLTYRGSMNAILRLVAEVRRLRADLYEIWMHGESHEQSEMARDALAETAKEPKA